MQPVEGDTKSTPPPTSHEDWQAQTSWQRIWAITWPVFLANVTFPLVGAVDTAMMGRLDDPSFVGGAALGSLVFNFIYFGFGFLRMATTGLVAQAHGRQDLQAIEHHLVRGLVVAMVLGSLVVVAMPIVHLAAQLMLMASDEVEALMTRYIEIRLLAVPAALGNAVLLGALFGRQQMRLVLLHITFVNLCNLVLNISFVMGLGMRIEGVAMASAIAQWAGFAVTLSLIRWRWRDILVGVLKRSVQMRPAWLDRRAFLRFFNAGTDLIIRTFLLLASEAVLLNSAAGLGDLTLASAQLFLVMFALIAFGLDGFAHAAEALVGDAIGRRNRPMMDRVVWRTNVMAGLSSIVIALLVLAGGPVFVGLMTTQVDLAAMTLQHWHWVVLVAPASFLAFQMDGIFVGALCSRDMRNAMIMSSFCFVVLILLLGRFGLNGILGAFILYLGVRGITLQWRMRHVRRLAGPAIGES
ncbi:MAG: MATE family efflux transporter [Candidatus Puniceispirillaceae bacterium]